MWNSEINYEINDENGTRITCTTLETLKRLVDKIRQDFPEETPDNEIMLPFEFIIGSLFPTSYEAVKQTMTLQFIEGYTKGKEEASNENSRVD